MSFLVRYHGYVNWLVHGWSFQSNCLCWMQATQISLWSKCKAFTASDSAQNVGAVPSSLVITHSYYVSLPGPLREMHFSRLRFDLPRWSAAKRSTSRIQLLNIILGVLTPGKGNRLILANTEELHHQIDLLRSRNRELENALQLMQENVSDQPHPLLRTDTLRIPTLHHDSSSAGPSTSSSSKSPTASRISPITDPPAPTESTLEEDHHTIDAFGPRYSWNLSSVFI